VDAHGPAIGSGRAAEGPAVDDLYPRIELPIPIDQFHILPRNPAYKYEYRDGRAVLTPRPKFQRGVLDLRPLPREGDWDVRPLPAGEVLSLAPTFYAAFVRQQPFASLDEAAGRAAARECLRRTVAGDDGPLIPGACFQLFDRPSEGPVGAALVTLEPEAIADDPFAGGWKEGPPADAVERRLGCPHLTWIFVNAWEARRGAGTRLLAEAAGALLGLGYDRLASTFPQGNEPSVFWHWRNGFRLVPWSYYLRRAPARSERPADGP
jgi:hypothetical protein